MKKCDIICSKKYEILVWTLIGNVIAFIVCAMVLSKSVNLERFYNVSSVYEIQENFYTGVKEYEKGHQESSGKVVLDEGEFEYEIVVRRTDDEKPWNYFCIQIDQLSEEYITGTLIYENQQGGEAVESEEFIHRMQNGMNLFPVSKQYFNIVRLKIAGENGTEFYVKDMQLRATEPVFEWGKAIKIYVIAFSIYMVLSLLLIYVWRRKRIECKLYEWIEALQNGYIFFAGRLRKYIEGIAIARDHKRFLRTLTFLFIFLYNVWVEMQGTYHDEFKTHIVVYSIAILFITMLSIEPMPEKKNWNHALVWGWLVLWLMSCVSDFLRPKEFRYVGYVMLFVVGFMFFVWNNMKEKYEFTEDFVRAIHIFFLCMTFFCVFCRPLGTGIRYTGFSKNPGSFALYLGCLWAVVLGELESRIRYEKKWLKILPYIIEGCIVISFCWESQSAGPLLCIAASAFLWFLRMLWYTKLEKKRKMLTVIIISALVLLLPVYKGIDFGIKNFPQMFDTAVTIEGEQVLERESWGLTVKAANLVEKWEKTRLGAKFKYKTISGLLAERDYYYRAFLRDMNLFGHTEAPYLWGYQRLAHNSILAIAHRYGIFASVPYIVMLIATIINTFKYSRKKEKYSAVPFYVCLISIVMSMTDNVELPFVLLPTIGLYLMMGIGFSEEEYDEEDNKKDIKRVVNNNAVLG